MSALLKIADVISRFTVWAGRFAVVLILAMIAIVFYNVMGRYIFGGGSPVYMQELEWHLLAPAMLIGISVLMLEGGHVRVDMVYSRLPTRVQHALDFASMILGAIVALLFIKYSQGFFQMSWSVREGSPDPGGLPARYILKAVIPVCFALLALQCIANAIRHFAALVGADGGERRAPAGH